MTFSPWRFCIAPMMDWSDRHCRYFWRLMSKHTRLYSEMVVTGAILHGDRERFLNFNAEEHPIALQLGGSDANELAACTKIAQEWGYDEVNLNCGCPSDRVQKGKIGAILMREPELVADCVSAMIEASSIAITVKHRIGVDEIDDYDSLSRFVERISNAGCKTFIVHARKAWLSGLSPKENREIPPLRYEAVARLKRDFPNLNIVINGGINTIEQADTLLKELDGVMVGREAYSNPYFIASIDRALFGELSQNTPSREQVIEQYAEYCEQNLAKNPHARLHHMSRHVLGLFSGQAGGKHFRRYLSEHAPKKDATAATLIQAMQQIQAYKVERR